MEQFHDMYHIQQLLVEQSYDISHHITFIGTVSFKNALRKNFFLVIHNYRTKKLIQYA